MDELTQPRVAIVSYNALSPVICMRDNLDRQVLVLGETFTPKCPQNVHQDDTNWQQLLSCYRQLDCIVIFAGKKESGALEIIRLAAETLADQRGKVLFLLCDHNLEEKITLIHALGFSETQYVSFHDGHTQCQEEPLLKGLAFQHIRQPAHA